MRSKGQVTNQQKLSLRESLGLRVRVRTSARNVEQVREQYTSAFKKAFSSQKFTNPTPLNLHSDTHFLIHLVFT